MWTASHSSNAVCKYNNDLFCVSIPVSSIYTWGENSSPKSEAKLELKEPKFRTLTWI